MSTRAVRLLIAPCVLAALAACGDSDSSAPSDDASHDASLDVAADASVDATADAPADAATDAAIDASADVAADAGAPPAFLTADEAFALVDPFIGSGGLGFAYAALTPAAQMPLGMVKLGPDSTASGSHPTLNHFSGYHYDDPHLRGFSHTHFIGTGAPDYGNLRVIPTGALPEWPVRQYYTSFDKQSEQAEPGWYAVQLEDPGIDVELTVGVWSGLHRYTFSGAEGAHVLFDAGASVTDAGVQEVSVSVDGELAEGHVVYRGGFVGRTRPFTLYFSALLDTPPDTTSVWGADGYLDATEVTAADGGVVWGWTEAPGDAVELRVGVSYVDLEQARAHRAAELDGRTFDEVRQAAAARWRELFGSVRIAGGTERHQTMFYTALYNAYRMPTQFSGVDGRYRGMDGEVHTADGWTYYTDLSLWDTFRTLHPWYELTNVEVERDVLRSLIAMCEQAGRMPRWPAALSFTGSMIGSSADFLFAGAALKGIDGIDYDYALDLLMASNYGRVQDPPLDTGRDGVEQYVALGWLPSDEVDESVSKTGEYAWADHALAELAQQLGRADDEAFLRDRADSWSRLLEPETGFLTPRLADGTFERINPLVTSMRSGPFTEGNAWHWRFYAPHAADALTSALGGADALVEALDTFFDRSALGGEGDVRAIVPDPYYWHGNEPTIHAAYLYHAAGRYDRVVERVRAIRDRIYGDGPDGLPGNDDGGTMSAWWLFSSVGIYPLAGTDRYWLGVPAFDRVEIDMDGGTLTIESAGTGPGGTVVRGVTLDGETMTSEVTHAALPGATLVFELE